MTDTVAALILIVEDDAVVALDLQGAALDAGFDAVLAPSASAARSLLASGTPAAAIVDLRLQDGMTGPDLVRELVGRGVTVIVVSGEVEAVRAIGLPAMACVRKPALSEAVISRVRSMLDRSSGAG